MPDELFCAAVAAVDAGDVTEVERLVTAHPTLLRDRLDAPGAWLRDKVGAPLDGFFQRPYLLWFAREGVESLQEQLDYALRLVSWSWIARDCHVQIDLRTRRSFTGNAEL